MTMDAAVVIYSIAVGFALVCAALVPMTYAYLSRGEWRRHAYGRHLMGSDTLLAAMLVFYFVAAITDFPVLERLFGAGLMVGFGYLRIQRTRFMRRSSHVTGYAAPHPKDNPGGSR